MLIWFMVGLIARCSGFDEIPLDRAEQSSNYNENHFAAYAIDNDLETSSFTNMEDPSWLRVYFKSSYKVEKVVIEKGRSYDATCVITVSVYDGETGAVCGSYTKPR